MELGDSAGSRQQTACTDQSRGDRGQGVARIFFMRYLNPILVLCIFVFLSCSSHEISIREKNKIQEIENWYLCLTEEMETFEKALDSEEVGEIKSRKSVLLKCNVQLLDDITDNLVTKHQIKIVKKPNSTSGTIRLDAMCRWEQYVSVDISIYEPEQNLLAEVEIKNGQDIFVKNDKEFAQYCANVIAKIILSQ